MAERKRAPGGGRKPIHAEPTVKVNVTLLPHQVAELKQLGEGNLSKGIRIMAEKYSRRQHLIEAVAGRIFDYPETPQEIEERNRAGWTVEVRWHDEEYISDSSFTEATGVILSRDDLAKAMQLAQEWETA